MKFFDKITKEVEEDPAFKELSFDAKAIIYFLIGIREAQMKETLITTTFLVAILALIIIIIIIIIILF